MHNPRKVIIIGAGGVGLEMIDLIDEMNASCVAQVWDVVGFLDDAYESSGLRSAHGLPILGPIASFDEMEHYSYVNAIGSAQDRTLRKRVRERLPVGDVHFPAWVHPRAFVSRRAVIGLGTVVNAGVVIAAHCQIGRNSLITYGSTLAHECQIGDHVVITSGVNLSGRVKVGDCAYLGVGASVIHDQAIGEEALVGAATMVSKGVPARARYLSLPKIMVIPEGS